MRTFSARLQPDAPSEGSRGGTTMQTLRISYSPILVALLLSVPMGAHGKLYKCVNAKGETVYQDKRCTLNEQETSIDAQEEPRGGPGEEECREIQTVARKVAGPMRSGVDSARVMASLGGPDSMPRVLLEVVSYVYSFKASTYRPARIAGLAYSRCMSGGFTFASQGSPEPYGKGSGSGILINGNGDVLTNNHVVSECNKVSVAHDGNRHEAEVVAHERDADLAVVASSLKGGRSAEFRSQAPELGENVVVAGFPLKGLLSSGVQVTVGTVSALAGIANDARVLQLTAPVQPGNSGGPALDESGRVIGVIVAKLDAVRFAEVTGDIPQNVNFAIKGSVALDLLRSHGIRHAISGAAEPLQTKEVADIAKGFTVAVECE